MNEDNTKNEIAQMTKALIKFQQEVPEINFNAQVKYGATNFKYADLAQMLKILRPLLNAHGFALSQLVETRINGTGEPFGVVKTILLHESGEALTSDTFYNITGKAQDQGAGITYARRYALAAICGICAEEDGDGPQSSKEPSKPKKAQPTEKQREELKAFIAQSTSAIEIKGSINRFKKDYELSAAMEVALDNLGNKRIQEMKS